MAFSFECVKVALKQDRTGFVLTLSIHPDEIPEDMLRDYVGSRYGCALVRINDDETVTKELSLPEKAGILCKSPRFHAFLKEMGWQNPNEQDAIEFIYAQCEIKSRTELNGNAKAIKKYNILLDTYGKWNERNQEEPF